MTDDDVRASCFGQLAVLCAESGEDVSYRAGLDRGFTFRGFRVPYLSPQKGIFRAAAQRGPAALSIQTSYKSPYGDEETPDGFVYAYRSGDIDQPDNRALRAAFALRVPLVYFVGTRPGAYQPHFPCYVIADDPATRSVLVTKGKMVGPLDDPEPVLVDDVIERRYVNRDVKVRLHQARFRGQVVPAYQSQCAMCRLKEMRLLDAAHIVGDLQAHGQATIRNGVSLCSIHHRAYDHDLVGVTPDYRIQVSRRLLDDDDGPMLELLKGFHDQGLHVPERPSWRPDPERLAKRYERFLAHGQPA